MENVTREDVFLRMGIWMYRIFKEVGKNWNIIGL
jgi:hypothetical protein